MATYFIVSANQKQQRFSHSAYSITTQIEVTFSPNVAFTRRKNVQFKAKVKYSLAAYFYCHGFSVQINFEKCKIKNCLQSVLQTVPSGCPRRELSFGHTFGVLSDRTGFEVLVAFGGEAVMHRTQRLH